MMHAMPASARSNFHRGILAFDAGTKLQVKSPDELPSRILVGPWGTHQTSKGPIIIDEKTVQEMPRNQKLSNFDRIALDFNHNTVPDSDSYRGEPAKIAAMGTPSVVSGEGISLNDLSWTPDGRDYVAGNHYIDVSPTVQTSPQNQVIFLHSAALCRTGAIPGLTLFSSDPLTETAILSDDDARKILCQLLGLPPTASGDELIGMLRNVATSEIDQTNPDSAIYENLKTYLSGKGGLSEEKMRVLEAFAPGQYEDVIQEVINRNLGISGKKFTKFDAERGIDA